MSHSFLLFAILLSFELSLKLALKQVTSIFTMWFADCWAFSPAARSPVALWEVPGCSGVTAQLVDWHGGAHGQSKTPLCRVQSCQGADTRAESKPYHLVQRHKHMRKTHQRFYFCLSTSTLQTPHDLITLPFILFNWHPLLNMNVVHKALSLMGIYFVPVRFTVFHHQAVLAVRAL